MKNIEEKNDAELFMQTAVVSLNVRSCSRNLLLDFLQLACISSKGILNKKTSSDFALFIPTYTEK